MSLIAENLKSIHQKVSLAAQKSGRRAEDIMILAATKTVDPFRINEVLEQGIINIGENRVQELCDKYDSVSDKAVWHLIGHLQTNKVKYIIDKASLIHSVDSEKLICEIENQAKKHGITAHILIEVNQSGEESKFGISPSELEEIIERNEEREYVKIDGLMTVAPNSDESEVREVFSSLNKTFLKLSQKEFKNTKMKYLSMGMSGDYEIAIEEGANIVRIGSAIFGKRNY